MCQLHNQHSPIGSSVSDAFICTRQSNSVKSSGLYCRYIIQPCNCIGIYMCRINNTNIYLYFVRFVLRFISTAYVFQVHPTNVTVAQITGLLNIAVPHQKHSVQHPPGSSADIPGVGRRIELPGLAPSFFVGLTVEDCSQPAPLLSLIGRHPLSP